jgi:hypothetical protein
LALLHANVCQMDYEGLVMDELSNLKMCEEVRLQSQKDKWFLPFYAAYVTYLAKLPSIGDVYLRAKKGDVAKISCDKLLIDVFRLVNQMNLLTEALSSTFNTIGRYYKEQVKVYRPLYKVLWE